MMDRYTESYKITKLRKWQWFIKYKRICTTKWKKWI